MLKIYRAPNGCKFQFEEGEQPDGYVLAEKAAKAPANKKAPRKSNKKQVEK